MINSSSSYVSDKLIPFCLNVGGLVSLLVTCLGGVLYLKQDSLLYFPEIGGLPRRTDQNPRGFRSPSERNLDFENCRIRCSDGVEIHGWLITPTSSQEPSTKVPAPTIIFFHGNAGNIGFRLPNAVKMIQETSFNILLVEYRGYGDSDYVTPNEAGLRLDAQAALQFCLNHDKIDHSRLFLFGRSLGGAVAFHAAHFAQQNNILLSGIMVENTFTCIADMVDVLMPVIAVLKSFVLRISWDSTVLVPTLTLPMLFLTGNSDELVPPSQMTRLVELARRSESVHLHVIEGGTHNECWIQGGKPYWKAIADFTKQHAGRVMRVKAKEATDNIESIATTAEATGNSWTSSKVQEYDVHNDCSAIPTISRQNIIDIVDSVRNKSHPSISFHSSYSTTSTNNDKEPKKKVCSKRYI